MHKAGLKNIGCRISDCVTYLHPSMEPQKKKELHEALCNEGLALREQSEEMKTQWRDRLSSHGISTEEIETQMSFELELDFRNKGESYHTVFPGLLTWSYGTVEKDDIK